MKHAKKKKKRVSPGIIILAAALLIAAGAFLAGSALEKSEKSFPNLYAGDIALGGLNEEEIKTALKEGGWEEKTAEPLKVSILGLVDLEIDRVKAGGALSSEALRAAAEDYGKKEGPLKALIKYAACLFGSTDLNLQLRQTGEEYIDNQITLAGDNLNELFGAEQWQYDYENAVLSTRKGWGDLKLDTAALKEEIINALEEEQSSLEFSKLLSQPAEPDFAALDASMEKECINAAYSDDGLFEVIDGQNACSIDVSEAQSLWQEAEIGEIVEIPLSITEPEVTGDMLRSALFHDLLGAMTTRFTNSSDERISNLQLCSSKIDGYILYPGQTFSYNDIVGPRTEEAGFLSAPAYVNGEVKDEPGGGACQVSSTIYAATAFAFLETVERTCHQFEVNYMQPGTDATVAWPQDGGNIVDFKFKNNKSYPIKIVIYCNTEERTLTAEIWGTLEEGDYMPLEFDNSYFWMQDYDRFIDPAYEGREGYKIKLTIVGDTYVLDDGGKGCYTHRQVFDSAGSLIEDNVINLPNASGGPGMDEYHIHPTE